METWSVLNVSFIVINFTSSSDINFAFNSQLIDIIKYFRPIKNIVNYFRFQSINYYLLFKIFLHCYGFSFEIKNLIADFNFIFIMISTINFKLNEVIDDFNEWVSIKMNVAKNGIKEYFKKLIIINPLNLKTF